jgi:hypothetical protein
MKRIIAALLLVTIMFAGLAKAQASTPAYLTLPFSDDFSDASFTSANWTETDIGAWVVSNGEYTCSAPTGGTFVGSNDWRDYTLSFDVKGTDIMDKIIDFHSVDDANHYGINFLSHPDNRLLLVKSLQGYSPTVVSQAYVTNYNGDWYHVKIELVGARIRIYVDNVLRIDYTDRFHPTLYGKVLLSCGYDRILNHKIYFDNVVITTQYAVYLPAVMKPGVTSEPSP